MDRIVVTPAGAKKLENELKHLKTVERTAIIAAIAEARGHGDLSENAEYSAAKEKQSFIEGRISDLEGKVGRFDIIDPTKVKATKTQFGATMAVTDVDTNKKHIYCLVGPDEADIDQGLISITSPLGRALMGKVEGDEINFVAPGGKRTYEIEKVEYKEIVIK